MPDEPIVEGTVDQIAQPAQNDWRSSLSPEYRELPSVAKFKSPDDIVKSYVNLEKLVGGEKIPVPKDDADEAAWTTVFNRLGRPESPDKYQVELKLAEGLSVPDEALNGFKQAAFKAGLSNKQIQSIMGYWADIENAAYMQRLEAEKTQSAESETTLRRKLGANYEAAKKNVEAFVNLHYPEGKRKAVVDRLMRDPEEFEALYNASKNFSEDSLGASKPIGFSPAEAEKEYNKILHDFKGPYYDSLNPEHEATKKRMVDLLGMMEAAKSQ